MCSCDGVMAELIETCAHACNAFIKAEMALNDGDLPLSQKYTKEGQTLVNALKKDTFIEVEELLSSSTEEVNDYDYPNSMELIKALNEINMSAGSYMAVEHMEGVGRNIAVKNLTKAINTVKEIYDAMFEN